MKRADLLVVRSELAAQKARDDLLDTLLEIRRRLDPRIVAAEAAEGLVGRANYLLEEVQAGVKNRPLLSIGGVAAFLVAVALRIWLARNNDDDDET